MGEDFNIMVRPFSKEDLEQMAELHRDAIVTQAPAFYPPEIVALWGKERDPQKYWDIYKQGESFWVAEEQGTGRLLGFSSHAQGAQAYQDPDDVHRLHACYVRGDAAGKGVGKALYQAVEDHVRQLGATELKLESSLVAEHFYESLGFQELQRSSRPLDADPSVMMNTISMVKTL